MIIYMIEVYQEKVDRWVPIYQPCYNIWDAEKKLVQKSNFLPNYQFRIAKYERDIYWKQREGIK